MQVALPRAFDAPPAVSQHVCHFSLKCLKDASLLYDVAITRWDPGEQPRTERFWACEWHLKDYIAPYRHVRGRIKPCYADFGDYFIKHLEYGNERHGKTHYLWEGEWEGFITDEKPKGDPFTEVVFGVDFDYEIVVGETLEEAISRWADESAPASEMQIVRAKIEQIRCATCNAYGVMTDLQDWWCKTCDRRITLSKPMEMVPLGTWEHEQGRHGSQND